MRQGGRGWRERGGAREGGGPGAAGPLPPSANRLARSTLTLVPLLGVHEVVFAPVTEEQARGALRFAKLGFEIFLSSFQVLRRGAGGTPFGLGPSSPERAGGDATIVHRCSH